MNRFVAGFAGISLCFAAGCSSTGVGDPCTPEGEFSASSGSSNTDELGIDVNSVQCETRVCVRHYFRGRVSCPFGNGDVAGQTGHCLAAPINAGEAPKRGLYTIDGVAYTSSTKAPLCCPVIGDLEQKPISNPVKPQCASRPAREAVYCSCRCDVPSDPDIDRSQVNLCTCPDGFSCRELCNAQNCSLLPKGKWGSYCVKDGRLGADYDSRQAAALCGADLTP